MQLKKKTKQNLQRECRIGSLEGAKRPMCVHPGKYCVYTEKVIYNEKWYKYVEVGKSNDWFD